MALAHAAALLDDGRHAPRAEPDFPAGERAAVEEVIEGGAAAAVGGEGQVGAEGEDAVNVIQRKTAVAPVVEVRDRNDQPVAGAIVNFTIRAGRATFGGARTVTVATDAAGNPLVDISSRTATPTLGLPFTGNSAYDQRIAQAGMKVTF